MTKVNFNLASPEKIVGFIFDLKDSLKKENLSERSYSPCIYIKIEPKLKKELFYAKELSSELKEKLMKKIKKKMEPQKEEMIKFLDKVRSKWEEVEEIYFKEMKKFFRFEEEKEFYCYINNCVVSSYFQKNKISLTYFKEFENDLDRKKEENLLAEATFIIAEEILHLLYFDYIKNIFNRNFTFDEIYDMGDDDYSGWHLTELIPEYLLVHNPVFKKFGWDKIDREKKGYFWISKIRKKTDPIYKKNSFKDFIIEIHKPFFTKFKKES